VKKLLFATKFKLTVKPEIKEPIGMFGSRLEASFHVVVGQASSIRNVEDVFKLQRITRNYF
jgi:cell division ATPase FtsA